MRELKYVITERKPSFHIADPALGWVGFFKFNSTKRIYRAGEFLTYFKHDNEPTRTVNAQAYLVTDNSSYLLSLPLFSFPDKQRGDLQAAPTSDANLLLYLLQTGRYYIALAR